MTDLTDKHSVMTDNQSGTGTHLEEADIENQTGIGWLQLYTDSDLTAYID